MTKLPGRKVDGNVGAEHDNPEYPGRQRHRVVDREASQILQGEQEDEHRGLVCGHPGEVPSAIAGLPRSMI